MSQSLGGFNANQNIQGNVQRVNAAARDINENHFHPPAQETTGSLKIKCIGVKITGLNKWHTGMIIALGGYFSCELMSLLKEVVAVFGSIIVKACCGSLELLIFTTDKKSKKKLVKDLLSNNIKAKIKAIVGDVKEQIGVQVNCIGAVIATNEELSKLQKHLRAKQKKIQWKIENNCKSSLMDLCCTLPIFQNKSRMIVEYISPKEASDYLKCVMLNCEFYVLRSKFSHQNKQGFLAKHPNFVDFTRTQQSHPGLQNKVVRIVKSFTEDETISTKLWKINDLLAIDPKHFPGDCDWVLRNLSKISKSLAFAKEFKVVQDLLLWMIRLLDNLAHHKTISWFWFILKLAVWLKSNFSAKFVHISELQSEISCQAKTIFKEESFCVPGLIESRFVNCGNLIGSINFLLKQKSKSTISIATYVAEQLALYRFQFRSHRQWRYFRYVISDLVDAIHQCLNMPRDRRLKFILIEILKNLIPKNCFVDIKLNMLHEIEWQKDFHFFSSDWLFTGTVRSLLERSEQSHRFLVKKKYFSQFCGQNCFCNLQIILFKLIYLANSQCQPQAASSVKLSEVISRAYFSKFPLQSRDANLENFYSDAIKLFKDVKVAPRSESFFEVYKHGQLVIDHSRSTSRSDYVKIRDLERMLSQYKILFELKYMFIGVYKLEDLSDSTSEFSKELDQLILDVFIQMREYATRILQGDSPHQRLITPHKLTDTIEKSDVKAIARQFLELEFPHIMQKNIDTSKKLSLTVPASQTLQRESTLV